MDALLLAAGEGRRLRPLTEHVPKCLVEIAGRPLLSIWFDRLFRAGIERAVVNTFYKAEAVERFVESSPWRERVRLWPEDALLGTAGTLVATRHLFARDDYLLAHADNLATFDVARFIQAHRERPAHCAITMLTFRTSTPESCGIVDLDAGGVVQAFHEKVADPPSNLANGAVYIVSPEVADYAAGLGQRVLDFSTQVIPNFIGRIYAVETDGYHRDIGTPESLETARAEIGSHALP